MTEIADRGYAHPEVLVSTDWVAAHLDDPNVRIVESNEDLLLYASGHIPGAVKVDWARDLNDQLRRDYLDRPALRGADAARIGIDDGHDRRLLRRQEQLVGDLRLLGLPALRPHERQDHGRRPAEVGEGRARADHATCRATPRPATRRRERDDATIRAFRDEVLRARRAASGTLVDVRSPQEYSAASASHMPEYPQEGALRGGHIPGAKSVPWARAANPRTAPSRPPTSCAPSTTASRA